MTSSLLQNADVRENDNNLLGSILEAAVIYIFNQARNVFSIHPNMAALSLVDLTNTSKSELNIKGKRALTDITKNLLWKL